ncbi:MAG: hypothetical protein JWO38_8047 [Gemmataceae bacterium]|nr:hypothetical protein [Gemmataceae bacterium]
MTRRTGAARRAAAFTLVELLVAMSVLVVLASLALLVVPSALDQDRTTDGATLTRQYLMIAKSRASRDQLPRGVRLVVGLDTSNPAKTSSLFVTELQYTEAPPIFLATAAPNAPTPAANAPAAQVTLGFNYTVTNGNITAQQCYLLNASASMTAQIQADLATGRFPVLYVPVLTRPDLPGPSGWFHIQGFTAGSPSVLTLDLYPDLGAATQYVTNGFGIYGAPRPLIGEPTQQLPKNICIDLNVSQPPGNAAQDYDILFGPNGQVLPTSGNGSGQINLWVRDYTKGGGVATLASFQQGGEQQVVALKSKSGSLGVFPLMWPPYGSGQDPFAFARLGATAYGQ